MSSSERRPDSHASAVDRPPRSGQGSGNGTTARAAVGGGAESVAPGRSAAGAAMSTPGTSRGDRTIPIRGVGARLVSRMEESLSVPTATSFRDVPARLLQLRRAQLNRAIAPRKLSLTHLVAYAIAQAVAIHPRVATFYREMDGHPHRVEPGRVGLGIAVDIALPDGQPFLVVPVIAGADELPFAEFVAVFDDLVGRARDGRLSADEQRGATITLTNPGTVGTTASVPRLVAGQGTIVATGAIRPGGDPVMTMSSTYDHRVIQGAESGRFLRTVDELLQGSDGFYESVAESLGVRLPPEATGWGTATADASTAGTSTAPAPAAEPGAGPAEDARLGEVASAMALVRSYRQFGHRAARLDPLGSDPPGDPSLDPAAWGLTSEAMARVPAHVLRVHVPGRTLAEVVPELRRTYCGTLAFEVEHIGSQEERAWLRRAIESGDYRPPFGPAARRRLLARLTSVEAFEQFLHRAYLGQKRFSIEGLDVLVPMLDQLMELVAAAGTRTVEIGMAHRGRLSVLTHVVGVAYAAILEEFERGKSTAQVESPLEAETSDVKYHRGAEGDYDTPSGVVRVRVSSNPSHLEAVDPVVEGRARAEQTDRSGPMVDRDTTVAIAALIHGDAAFAAQGVVAETFNLARLEGYSTGGTIHLIANNQLGFTVDPKAARSTDYASDLAKGFDVPIIHVNADDPEACLAAIRLGVAYREQFHGDVVIDVVGYRRHGHNEEDEPAYTQPLMYERIARHPTIRVLYRDRLAAEGVVEPEGGPAELERGLRVLAQAQEALTSGPGAGARGMSGSEPTPAAASAPVSAGLSSAPLPGAPARRAREVHAPDTRVPAERLAAVEEALLAAPPGFTVHPKLVRQIERRRAAFGEGRIAWGQAEALAFGSLLLDGAPIRLTGQDTARGTFSQRHLVLHDAATGETWSPMRHLPGATAPFELHDSPLSEYACMGFEYGYAVAAPGALVLWEAQYGDFANVGEVIVDQFVIAGLAKWGQTSRLTLLLPHGYEGQGPEHSSARLERFLALGAEGNIRVANCTTPAQYFHLLRDQALRAVPRPLVLLTPKSLLRIPAATSSLAELTGGGFRPVLDDHWRTTDAGTVRRLVLCSGRVYYDLLGSPRRAERLDVAIARIELLYPFPGREVRELVGRYPALESVVWVQEEPRNMGARKFVLPKLRDIVTDRVPILDVCRPERSAPAEGYQAAHRAEQARIVAEALAI